MPSVMELLVLLGFIIFIFILALVYSLITSFTLKYFSKKSLPIKKLLIKYFSIIMLSKVIAIFGKKILMLLYLKYSQYSYLIFILAILFLLLVDIVLINKRIKDNEQKPIGYKVSTVIVIINYLLYFITIIIFMLVK